MPSENYNKRIKAREYLKATDWYVIRKADVGTAIPSDIQTKRAQARLDANGDINNPEE
tara:strand:+ start:289 stop:462 length:174 start_codon:yes stop_codon:yes gene_type:complete